MKHNCHKRFAFIHSFGFYFAFPSGAINILAVVIIVIIATYFQPLSLDVSCRPQFWAAQDNGLIAAMSSPFFFV